MVKISKLEKDQIIKLSAEFVSIHKQIMDVEKSIIKLKNKSAELLENLENCRKDEKTLISQMQEKYGSGSLDPVSMEWKKEQMEHGIEK